jgi:uncharacterized SAM-binding protein YcdF (DUF218 family)
VAAEKIIVVPDGIVIQKGKLFPSFVYKSVLDEVLRSYSGCQIFLAPANSFGYDFKEQFVAYDYLISKNKKLDIVVFDVDVNKYIDTWGNAKLLKQYLNTSFSNCNFDCQPFTLVVGYLHAKRARLCFEKNGFNIHKCVKVAYDINEKENMPIRLFYYKYKFLHLFYECIAILLIFLKRRG